MRSLPLGRLSAWVLRLDGLPRCITVSLGTHCTTTTGVALSVAVWRHPGQGTHQLGLVALTAAAERLAPRKRGPQHGASFARQAAAAAVATAALFLELSPGSQLCPKPFNLQALNPSGGSSPGPDGLRLRCLRFPVEPFRSLTLQATNSEKTATAAMTRTSPWARRAKKQARNLEIRQTKEALHAREPHTQSRTGAGAHDRRGMAADPSRFQRHVSGAALRIAHDTKGTAMVNVEILKEQQK